MREKGTGCLFRASYDRESAPLYAFWNRLQGRQRNRKGVLHQKTEEALPGDGGLSKHFRVRIAQLALLACLNLEMKGAGIKKGFGYQKLLAILGQLLLKLFGFLDCYQRQQSDHINLLFIVIIKYQRVGALSRKEVYLVDAFKAYSPRQGNSNNYGLVLWVYLTLWLQSQWQGRQARE